MKNFTENNNIFALSGRNPCLDSAKGLLILLTFFGNFLHTIPCPGLPLNYLYLFHIPLFVFISGYVSKHVSFRRTIMLILIYLIYGLLLNPEASLSLPELLKTPPSFMWYIASLIFWRLTQPLLAPALQQYPGPVILLFFALSLGIGFVPYDISQYNISRTITYWPLYLLGVSLSPAALNKFINNFPWIKLLFYNLLILLFCLSFSAITPTMYLDLYNKYNYAGTSWGSFSIVIRLTQFIAAALIGTLLTRLIFKHNPKILSQIGRQTLTVYICLAYIISACSACWRELWLPLWQNICLGTGGTFLCAWIISRLAETLSRLTAFCRRP